VHQHFSLVSNLTVSENITLGLKSKGYPFTDRKYLKERLLEISDRYGLAIDPDARISSLSVGEQQRVEIIKLLYRNAELLILDEPTAVLTPGEIKDFFRVLRRLREDGCSVIIITHRIPEVMEIADRITVLRDAQAVFTGEVAALTETQLSEHMIGRQLKLMNRDTAKNYNKPSLQVEHISMQKKDKTLLTNVSIQIAPGEILGIAGVDGNGQKYLAEAILGIRKYQSGSISLAGKKRSKYNWVIFRRVFKIGILDQDILLCRLGKTTDESRALALILLVGDCADVLVREGFHGCKTAVGTAVVGKDNLPVGEIRAHVFRDGAERGGDDAFFVIHRDDE
jgi:simple sugar transport system ATP-binding protein